MDQDQRLVLDNYKDLIKFFAIKSFQQLGYLCYGKNTSSEKLYKIKKIPKRDGSTRTLLCPNTTLKRIQKHILYQYCPRKN